MCFVLLVFAACGLFLYLKFQVMGSPDSKFNQYTRFKLGQYPIVRTILGLHNAGDARLEYLGGQGPLVVKWFAPVTETVDTDVLRQFADLAGKYTGRTSQVVFGGQISEGTVDLSAINDLNLKGPGLPKGATVFNVVFVTDYKPRDDAELSTTHGETTAVISLGFNRQFLSGNQQYLDNYLLSGMLHEFGNEIGLDEKTQDYSCVMNLHAGIEGQPLEKYGRSTPQDFCAAEAEKIREIKNNLK